MLEQFANNFIHSLFKPLRLFFYMGFAIPLLKVVHWPTAENRGHCSV